MSHQLLELLSNRISAGLKRKTITTTSSWAEAYRVMGKPFAGRFTFDRHPWSKEMHDCESEMMVGQKAAQLSYTETALNKIFKAIDIEGTSAMYILPTTNEAGDFSSSRFDPALEMSTHLRNLFSDVKNIGHKRAGNASLYVRGSRSRSQLKSVPVGIVILDELDEFRQENIALIFERMSGHATKQSFLLSTPTIDHYGINTYFRSSTQDHFFFVCPRCSKLTQLIFPECLMLAGESWTDPRTKESYLRCKECKGELSHEHKREWLTLKGRKPARWISSHTDRSVRGFYINQLYSPTVRPDELAVAFLKAQTNPTDEQEFYNSKLGLTHIVEGARVTDTDIHECTRGHKKILQAPPHAFCTMGVDVGKWLHCWIDQWFVDSGALISPDINLQAVARTINECKVLHFEELDGLMRDFGIAYCIIDANPEKRKALEFAQRFMGYVKLCWYARGINSKQVTIHAEEECTISVDRTSWLDLSQGRFIRRKIMLPCDLSQEAKRHIKALVRVYKKDAMGNPVGKYEKGNEDDHFAHSRNYSEIALQFAASNQHSEDIVGVV